MTHNQLPHPVSHSQMTHSLWDFQSSGVTVLEVLVVCYVNQLRDCHPWVGVSGEGRLCHFRSAVRWVWFVGVLVGISSCGIHQCSGSRLLMIEVRIVSLCLHPRMALLGSRQCWDAHCWIAHCWIVMRAGIKSPPENCGFFNYNILIKQENWRCYLSN
jgi:hypothetical protein